jgi:ribonuclease P protein component
MFSPDPSLDNPRVAYAIGRHFGNAVQRNRVRRQAKAVLRETQTELPKGRYLIGIRGSSPAPEFRQLRDELNGLLMRIKDHK